MKPTNDRPSSRRHSPKKRFRIEKLEERIAPKTGGNGTRNCPGSSANISVGGGTIY